MCVKIRVSYTEDAEEQAIMQLFMPVLDCFQVKKCAGTPPYKHIYFTSKKGGKPRK